MNILIRYFQSSDLNQVSDVVQRSLKPSLENISVEVQQSYMQRNSPEEFLKKRENVNFWVAEIDGKIVGVVGIAEIKIRTFYVDPDYQGKGVGRKLFEKVREEAVKRGYDKLVVQSSPAAEKVYEHLGFMKIEQIWKTREDGSKSFTVLMELSL
jgi:N-acetylglutamate synthase-like GNAT family acetyltransferase